MVIGSLGKSFMARLIPAQNLFNFPDFLKKKTENCICSIYASFINASFINASFINVSFINNFLKANLSNTTAAI